MDRINRFQDCGSRRRGSVLPAVAVSSTLLLGFVALTVDVGYLYNTAAECQRAADAASLAGAAALRSDDNSYLDAALAGSVKEEAVSAARGLLAMNPAANEDVGDDAIIEVGHWEGIGRTFRTTVSGRAVGPNAVRVVAPRKDVALFFAPVMGFNETDVSREAVASAGSGRCAGVWGIQGITSGGGIMTDSYDSTAGPYGSADIYANGDLCSCEDIRMGGSFEVNGDLMYGRGYMFDQRGVSGKVWGVVDDHSCGEVTTDADFGWAMLNHDNETIETSNGTDPFRRGNGWDLRMQSDDSITLTGGTYYFDSVRMTGQARIYVTGPTVIYVKGDGVFGGGGIVNATENPANLLVYSEGSTLSLKGGSGFHGAVYAPDSDVTVHGTSDYFGTIVGRTVHFQGDAAVHVDESIVKDLFGIGPTRPVLVK